MKLRSKLAARIALLVALTLGLGVVGAVPAFAAGTGTITVQAANVHGVALPTSGWLVFLQNSATNVNGLTNGSGQYTFSGVAAGHSHVYRVVVQPTGDTYVTAKKTNITISSGQTKTVTVDLSVGATIGGTLSAGASPLGGANVTLFDPAGYSVATATTSGSGGYQITVKSGTYLVQFNSRPTAVLTTAAQSDAWSYWKGTTKWTSAKSITVKQQTSTKAATHLDNIDGTVAGLYKITADVDLTGISTANLVGVTAKHNPDSFDTELNSAGTQFSTWVNPGSYQIAVFGNFDHILGYSPPYWYRGDTTAVTSTEKYAKWITVTSSNVTIHFNDAP